MKFSNAIVLSISGFLCAGNLPAQEIMQVTVQANMDIFRAAGYNDGSNGIDPVFFQFTARPNQTIKFPRITGQWTCQSGADIYGPDGETSGYCLSAGSPDIINHIGTFSGYHTTDFTGALVGMFLEDSLPLIPHPTLQFYVNNASLGGIRTDFSALNPKIGQVFFIGDGLTGTGTGLRQVFSVPPAATHLYLGYVDVCHPPGNTTPNCYTDNVGSLNVTLTLHKMQ